MRLPHTCIHVSTHQHTYSCIHSGKHEDTHTNFINRHVHKKYYLQIYSYSWCPCPRDYSKPVINSRSISFSVATFLDHCCSLSHNEHLEQDEPAELLFPLSYWRSISDPRVCLGELELLFSTCMGCPQPQLNSYHCHQKLFSDMRLKTPLRVIKMS